MVTTRPLHIVLRICVCAIKLLSSGLVARLSYGMDVGGEGLALGELTGVRKWEGEAFVCFYRLK